MIHINNPTKNGMDGWMDGQVGKLVSRQADGWVDRQINKQINNQANWRGADFNSIGNILFLKS